MPSRLLNARWLCRLKSSLKIPVEMLEGEGRFLISGAIRERKCDSSPHLIQMGWDYKDERGLKSMQLMRAFQQETRGLFWDGPRNFEPRSDDEDDTPSPNFYATPTERRLATTHDLACNRLHTRRIFSGIGFRTWSPPPPRPRPYH
ncbi:hypothetical protein AVEN_175605-1 [Araneus ventricosus]|uniref:Uncharacterized protein n=1 Tax=Araneus ventricosus TaxID=182803 RepID=A0A4Y2G3Q9_ARAVE|nr:hypothetical protein AVEN_175605-1 [Araneus ventricosus]